MSSRSTAARAGCARRAARATGGESAWTVLGASRGEAGILGEGIRQALLRDPTYRPALAAAEAMVEVSDRRSIVIDDPAAAAAERLAAAADAGGHIALAGGSTPRAAYERAAELDADWSARDALVRRRALRPARPRALELRHGQGGRCSTGSRGASRRPCGGWRASAGHEAGADAYEEELRERRSATTCRGSTWSCSGSGPTRTPRRSSRATPRSASASALRRRRRDAGDGAAGVPGHAYASCRERGSRGGVPGRRARTRPRPSARAFRRRARPARARQPRAAREPATLDAARSTRGGRAAGGDA